MSKFLASSIDGPVVLEAATLPEAIEEVMQSEWSDFDLPIFEKGKALAVACVNLKNQEALRWEHESPYCKRSVEFFELLNA